MCPMRVYTIHSRDAGGHVRGSGCSGSKFAHTLLRSLELCHTQGLRYEHGDPPMCRYTMLMISVCVTSAGKDMLSVHSVTGFGHKEGLRWLCKVTIGRSVLRQEVPKAM